MATEVTPEQLIVYSAASQVQDLLRKFLNGDMSPQETAVTLRSLAADTADKITREEFAEWVTPEAAIAMYSSELAKRIVKAQEPSRPELDMPWKTLRQKHPDDPYYILPLEAGLVGLVAAPDGMGKTLWAEQCAVYWETGGFNTAYVHTELPPQVMLDRRIGRKVGLSYGRLSRGPYPSDVVRKIKDAYESLAEAKGGTYYLYVAGMPIDKVMTNLRRAQDLYGINVVVYDYFNLLVPSAQQRAMFGSNTNALTENMYQLLKNESATCGMAALVIAQMTKAGKRDGKQMDRNSIMGSSAMTNFSNLVVLIDRQMNPPDEHGNLPLERYSPIVSVRVDKQTLGERFNAELFFSKATYQFADFRDATSGQEPPKKRLPDEQRLDDWLSETDNEIQLLTT